MKAKQQHMLEKLVKQTAESIEKAIESMNSTKSDYIYNLARVLVNAEQQANEFMPDCLKDTAVIRVGVSESSHRIVVGYQLCGVQNN